MLKFQLTIVLLFALASTTMAMKSLALQTILYFLVDDNATASTNRTNDVTQMTAAELGQSRGVCDYNFLDFITYRYERECSPDDLTIAHLLPKQSAVPTVPKPPIVKCLPAWSEAAAANGSAAEGANKTVEIMESIKDVVNLLKPIGNATKRDEAGSCVLIFFYTDTSLGCSLMAPHANRLPRMFPSIRVAAIDAFQFPSFSTEFGIVGLPTLLLFHQGRPIVKHFEGTYASFVTRITGIQPVKLSGEEEVTGPLPLVPVEKTDYNLALAWGFILICLGNYFAKSVLFQQIVEMVKRSWRESEAQLEHN